MISIIINIIIIISSLINIIINIIIRSSLISIISIVIIISSLISIIMIIWRSVRDGDRWRRQRGRQQGWQRKGERDQQLIFLRAWKISPATRPATIHRRRRGGADHFMGTYTKRIRRTVPVFLFVCVILTMSTSISASSHWYETKLCPFWSAILTWSWNLSFRFSTSVKSFQVGTPHLTLATLGVANEACSRWDYLAEGTPWDLAAGELLTWDDDGSPKPLGAS